MPDALKDFAIQVQHMREAQRAYAIQRVAANKLKTQGAMEEAEDISAEVKRLEKLVDESVSMIIMPGTFLIRKHIKSCNNEVPRKYFIQSILYFGNFT